MKFTYTMTIQFNKIRSTHRHTSLCKVCHCLQLVGNEKLASLQVFSFWIEFNTRRKMIFYKERKTWHKNAVELEQNVPSLP